MPQQPRSGNTFRQGRRPRSSHAECLTGGSVSVRCRTMDAIAAVIARGNGCLAHPNPSATQRQTVPSRMPTCRTMDATLFRRATRGQLYARQTGYGWRRDAELEERRREYWTQALPMYSETPNSIAISSSNKTAAHDSPLVARMRVSP